MTTFIARSVKQLALIKPVYCIRYVRSTVCVSCVFLLSACGSLSTSSLSSIAVDTLNPQIAKAYASDQNIVPSDASRQIRSAAPIKDGLGLQNNIALSHALAQALLDNHTIKGQQAIVKQAQSDLAISKAESGFKLNLIGNNTLQTSGDRSSANQSANLSLQGNWNTDFWGDLSAQTKAAQLRLARAEINLKQSKQQLIADITSAWYRLIYHQKQFDLGTAQQENTQAQLAAIESSYRQGLNRSLDVYLARSNLETARSNSVGHAQALSEASRKLELLFAAYPSGKLALDGDLLTIEDKLPTAIPSDLLRDRPDLNSRWLSVLIEDANVASRYAQQFPQFALSGNISLTATRLTDLFKQNIAWSLLASLNQSLIDNGRKKALYTRAQAVLIEREQEYLQALKVAFSEVENLLGNQKTLTLQWRLNESSLENTQLSFGQISLQYQNGIANYQQVLDIQQRLFERQKSNLDFKIALIDNRIRLQLALGTPSSGVDKAIQSPPLATLKVKPMTESN